MKKILITGLGCSGKSTFRKKLVEILKFLGVNIVDYDFDHDKNVLINNFVFPDDAHCIIEDVHGTVRNACFPLETYDLILYVMPDPVIYNLSMIGRAKRWFKNGQYAWDADLGANGSWHGTGIKYDPRNLPGIIKYTWNYIKNRQKWTEEDLLLIQSSEIDLIIL